MSDVMDNAARSAAAQTLPADPGKNISDTRTTTTTAATTLSATATTAKDTIQAPRTIVRAIPSSARAAEHPCML